MLGPGADIVGLSIGENPSGPVPYPAGFTQPAFLGLATVDSVTGQLVPAISEITVRAGSNSQNLTVLLDNFTFATPREVPPVREAKAGPLFAGTALAVVGLYRRRARTTP